MRLHIIDPFRKICALTFWGLLLISSSLEAGTIRGIIKDGQTGKPLHDCLIEIENTSLTLRTDSSGLFRIDSIPPGTWNISFYHESYEPYFRNDIYIAGLNEVILDIDMEKPLQKLEKVVVRAKTFKRTADMVSSTKIMTQEELLRQPGALLDIQRAMQDLPSVSSGGDNTNEIIVRGGNPGENLLVMDNIELPNPNHFADQGSGGGVISLINPLLVKTLTFNAGAPPAQYGGKASSVLDVKLRDGNEKIFLGGVDMGMAGIGIHTEGPITSNSTFTFSATKSFLDIAATVSDQIAIPKYWGLQGKYSLSDEKFKLYTNFLYGDNTITINNANVDIGSDGDKIESGGNVYMIGVNLDNYISDKLTTSLTLSGVGNNYKRLEYSPIKPMPDTFFTNNSLEQEQTLKYQLSFQLFENVKFQSGVFLKRSEFDFEIKEKPDTLKEYTYDQDSISAIKIVEDNSGAPIVYNHDNVYNANAFKYGGYFSFIYSPLSTFKIVSGLRGDGFTYNNKFNLSPRLGMSYGITSNLSLSGAFALQYQDPDYVDLTADIKNKDLDPKRVITGIIGSEYHLPRLAAKFSCELFYKKYNFLPVNESQLTADPIDESDRLLSIGEGRSYGVELFIHKKLISNFSGTLAYSYSQAENKDLRPGYENNWYPSDYDFGNAFTATAGYKYELIDKEWYKKLKSNLWFAILSPIIPIADRSELSIKWRYLGGRPRTIPNYDLTHRRWIYTQENLNNSRFDDYHKLDIRFERRFGFGFLQMIYYFDLQNVYNKSNVWNYLYSDRYEKVTPIYQFSFFPSGGMIIGF